MLDESIRQIFHTSLMEKYNKGTERQLQEPDLDKTCSLESHKDDDENELEVYEPCKANARELRSPEWRQSLRISGNGYQTPPYLSPGMTRRLTTSSVL